MSIRWDSEADWKDNQDSSGTTGQNGELKQGYSRDRPPLSDGLVGYWPLHDENATDYSGNGNHGSLNGGVTTGVAGKGGLQAMSFDGSNNVQTGFYPDGGDVSFSIWVYADEVVSDTQPVFGCHDGNERRLYLQTTNGDTTVTFAFGDSYWDTSVEFPEKEWTLFTVTVSNGEARLYMNGEEKASRNGTWGSGTSNDPVYLGGRSWDGGFGGGLNSKVSDARVYNRALTQSEIQTLYEWGSKDLASPPTDGVARYALDGDATDSWGSNDGTSSGGLAYSSDAIRGQSGDFDGTDDYIKSPSTTDVAFGTGDFSISLWHKPHDTSNENYLVSLGYNKTDAFLLWHSESASGQVNSRFTSIGSTNQFDAYLNQNEWQYITYVRDGGTQHIYINGVSVDSSSQKLGTISSQPIEIGYATNRMKPGSYTDGLIDDVHIYDRALSPSEVFELYRWGTKGRDMRKQLVNY